LRRITSTMRRSASRRAGEEEAVPRGAAGRFGAEDDRRVERVGQLADDQPDRRRAIGDQTLGKVVRPVAEPLDRVLDAQQRRGCHLLVPPVEHVRHRRDRHARLVRHGPDRNPLGHVPVTLY
jgi:hypothetical protein